MVLKGGIWLEDIDEIKKVDNNLKYEKFLL